MVGIQNAYLGSRQSSQRFFKDPETPYTGEVALTSVEVEKTEDAPPQLFEKKDLSGNEYLPIVEHSDGKKEATPATDLDDVPEDLYEDINNDETRDRRSCLNVSNSKSQLVPQHAGVHSAAQEVVYDDTAPRAGEEEEYVISQLVYEDSTVSRAQEDQGADMYEIMDIENSWQKSLWMHDHFCRTNCIDVF